MRRMLIGLGLLLSAGVVQARPPASAPIEAVPDFSLPRTGPLSEYNGSREPGVVTAPPLDPLEIRAEYRNKALAALKKPSLTARGPVETFHCQPASYHHLLDHPDQAVALWRKLGAECASISERGNGRFGWTDGQGSDVWWETVAKSPRRRVWYGQGTLNPGPLLPNITFKAVLILVTIEGRDGNGRPAMRQQAELNVQIDNRGLALLRRLLGSATQRAAEAYVAQVQTFFAALAWALDESDRQKPASR